MIKRAHRHGMDILGGDASAILIRVKNAPEVVSRQGALASLAQYIAPTTINTTVFYGKMRDKLADGLKQQGVDADVTVVDPVGWKPSGSNLWTYLGIAAGGTVLGWLLGRRSG